MHVRVRVYIPQLCAREDIGLSFRATKGFESSKGFDTSKGFGTSKGSESSETSCINRVIIECLDREEGEE
jgi:hypothetical protein